MSMPIRLIIGFLPGIEVKDARAFAQGYIERHMQAMDVAGWYVQRYKDGALYEIHEGGDGRAFLPSILKQLETDAKIYIPISGRIVTVEKDADGQISSLLMPEDFVCDPTLGLKGGPRLHPALGDARGWLFTGATFFVIGLVLFLMGSALQFGARYVYEMGISQSDVGAVGKVLALAKGEYPSQASREVIKLSDAPVAQWSKLINSTDSRYVKALRYEKGAWRLEYDEPVKPTAGLPEPPAAAGKPTTPPVAAPSTATRAPQ